MLNYRHFPSLFAYLGGTIGLFTGLSLISVVEIIYWLYKTVVDYCRKRTTDRTPTGTQLTK
jgi:hypothetical protein